MRRKKQDPEIEGEDRIQTRVHLSLSGKRAERLFELREILGFESNGEAAHYLLNRGMEACAMQVVQREAAKRLYAEILASVGDMQTLMEGLDTLPLPKKAKR